MGAFGWIGDGLLNPTALMIADIADLPSNPLS